MTKAEIINTAFSVWGRNFYQKTSLSHLARELKVSKPALYRHFRNKQALTNAMAERFYDDFSASVRDDFEKALKTTETDEGVYTIVRSITDFFARNVYDLLFCLINVYDHKLESRTIAEQIKKRGADIRTFQLVIEKKYKTNPAILKLLFASLIFYMSSFHKMNKSLENPPSVQQIQNIISDIHRVMKSGLGFFPETAEKIDFKKLEKQVEETMPKVEPEPLFKAVAEAVAEAGPWGASMDMVAKRMGISKSSLYGHIKSRKDMIRRLFVTEFRRIIEFARQGISLSANAAEQLYLGIFAIAVYLRSRPEVLVAIGWIRTRKLDLGKPEKNTEIFRLFEDVKMQPMQNAGEEERQRISHWILFLLINTLIQPHLPDDKPPEAPPQKPNCFSGKVQNNDIRDLYRFITLGLGGFLR